jgi:hypothetical protein
MMNRAEGVLAEELMFELMGIGDVTCGGVIELPGGLV